MYDGPARPLEEVAVIIVDTSSHDALLQSGAYIDNSVYKGNREASWASISAVDDKSVWGKRIVILPGRHTIHFGYSIVIGREGSLIKSRQTSGSIPFTAEAGKTYYIYADVKWNADHTDAPYGAFSVRSLPYIEPW